MRFLGSYNLNILYKSMIWKITINTTVTIKILKNEYYVVKTAC